MLGWEATIGVGLSGVLMLFALALPGRDAGRLENAVHAYLQMVHSPQVCNTPIPRTAGSRGR